MNQLSAPSPARRMFASRWIVFTGLLIVAGVAFSLARTIGKDETFQGGDFAAYYRAGELVAEGKSPYVVDMRSAPFVYSPAVAYLFAPLQPFGYLGAVRVWTLINWALCLACVAMTWRLVRTEEDDAPLAVIWLAVIPMISYFWNNVRSGQAGALVMACCIAWALCRRSGWRFVGGMFLAGAVALKVFPIFLVPYLVMRRDWRGLLGTLVGGAALILLPIFWVGPEGVVSLHRQWVEQTLNTQTFDQTARPPNQSVLGMLARLPHISNGVVCFSTENLNAAQRMYPTVALVLAGLVYAFIGWNFRRPVRGDGAAQENLHLSILFVLVALITPRAWTCNFVTLLLPCMILARIVWCRSDGWPIASAGLLVMFLASVAPPPPDCGDEWRLGVWLYQGRHLWAALGLAIACLSISEGAIRLSNSVQQALRRLRLKSTARERPVDAELERIRD